jgi:hypothetical protein
MSTESNVEDNEKTKGRMKREAVPEMVRAYMTGRMITPEYVKRTKVEAVVSDAYEIGTKVSGEAALSAAKT